MYSLGVRLYQLDEVDESLSLLPMAARRALDAAGLKLSLAGWQALPLPARRTLAELGSSDVVDVERVHEAARDAAPKASACEPRVEPSGERVPEAVAHAFGEERPIPAASWSALGRLDRYVMMKVAEKGRPRRLDAAYREIIGDSAHSSHLAPEGGVRMVDVGSKAPTQRTASAASQVHMNAEAFSRLRANNPKGDVLGTARLAGIMAAKRTSELIPLCHPIAVTKVEVRLTPRDDEHIVQIEATVEAFDRTGVEMEALTAASGAALTVYDMLKAFDRSMTIGPTRLLTKTGGRTGDYQRASSSSPKGMT